MRHPTLPAGGTCRCTAIRFELRAAPLLTLACHCKDCQRLSASAFSLSAILPPDGFALIRGAPVTRPLPGSPRQHAFCPDCMTWLYTTVDGAGDSVRLRPTLCEDTSWVAPFVDINTRHKLPWAVTGAVHGFETVPAPDAFKALLAAYAAWQHSG